MKVYLGGIFTETNTFSPIPLGERDFDVIRAAADFPAGGELAAVQARCDARRWDLTFGLFAFALPSGTTLRRAYEALRDELLARLRAAMPVDIVILPLHGAMVADGYDDCEGDLIQRVRELVGPTVVIGVGLDLHCHLTERMLAHADAVTIYHEYPHTDIAARAEALFDLCAATALEGATPTMAMFDCRMMGLYPTSHEPMRSFVNAMRAAEGTGGILSLSLAHGFPWGDVPDCGARMLAISDGDAALAAKAAAEWGRRFYGLRRDVSLRPLDMDEAIDRALAAPRYPVVLADQADNPGGGAPGDSTFLLRRLLERGVQAAALGMIWDPIAVRLAHAVGPGARLDLRLGGKMGPASGDALDLRVEVTDVAEAMYQRWPQSEGDLHMPCGDTAALKVAGIDVVICARRTQVFSPDVFTNLGISVTDKRLIVVKSAQHFYRGFQPIASDLLYVAAPGAVPVRIADIPLSRVDRQKYPWVEDPLGLDPVA